VIHAPAKQLLVLIGRTDTWHERPLYEAIVAALEREGLAGVSVLSGVMGYGAHRRIHRKGLFGVSDDKPVAIVAIDNEARIRAGADAIRHMVREGLIAISDVEVLLQAGDDPADAETVR
jgi:PII-like signaling protein